MKTWAMWLAAYLVHSTLLIALALLASRFVRSASMRDTLWKGALVGAFLTATLVMVAPFEGLGLPWRGGSLAVTRPVTRTVSAAVSEPRAIPRQMDRVDAMLVAVAGHAFLAALLLGRAAFRWRRFAQAIASRKELLRGPVRSMLDTIARRAGCARPIRLTQSAALVSPVAMPGWEIVIAPDVFRSLTPSQQETILAHELAHLQRRDPQWRSVAEIVKALFFFQPLNWLVAAKLEETSEFLCDDAAVRQTGDAGALAETLAELAARVSPVGAGATAMAEPRSNLIVRVSRMLSGEPPPPLGFANRIILPLSLLAAVAVIAPRPAIASGSAAAKWSANISFNDGTTQLKITAENVAHDDGVSGKLAVVERTGESERSFRFVDGAVDWRGEWRGESREQWLRRVLIDRAEAEPALVDAILN